MSEILAKRLKAARESKGWTQAYLADLLGLTNGTISGYERNYREPDMDTLSKIAGLLGVTTDYLLGNDDWKVSENNPMNNLQIHDPPETYVTDVDDLEAFLIPAIRRAWSKLPPDQLERKIKLAKKAIKIAEMLENEEM